MFSLQGYLPVYLFARRVDGVNYSNETVWEGRIEAGETYKYHNKKGFQFITEATDLGKISNEAYDFILSCHSLEHVANPLKALKEWNRVTKPGGYFALILPDKRYTFDFHRPYTTIDHLLSDYNNNTDEYDETHFEEVIRYHDPTRHSSSLPWEEEVKRIKSNYKYRCVHHHVFDVQLVEQMLSTAGFKLTFHQEAPPFHLIFIAVKQ
jgi:ubiquinone/menaquinone biosynthesis C-methylase UbiE